MSLFGSKTRRRHQPGTPMRRAPGESQQDRRRRRVGTAEALGCAAVAIICVALISLIWITTERAIREQSDDTRGRVEAVVTAQAITLAALAQHELQMIDQSLTILQRAWDDNPDTFNLADWRKKMPALADVTDDLFIASDLQVIVQDINPAAVGQGIGSAYATFASGSLEPIQRNGSQGRDNAMLIGELGSGGVVRQYLMYMLRPLQKSPGWHIGASYRSTALTTVFASAGLGPGGLAALIDTHVGGVQAVAGTAALRPTLVVVNTPMYEAMLQRPDGGIWDGRTAIDRVDRIVGFRRIPGRDLIVLVGVERGQAMAPADNWAAAARSLAAMATLLVLAIGATLLWELWHWRSTRRRRRALAQAETLLEAIQADLAAMRLQATVGGARVQAMLGGVSEGVAVIDGHQHLAAWNSSFAASIGVAGDVLREGLLLEDLLRQQVPAGRFGAPEDVDAEVARIVSALRTPAGSGEVALSGPDGTTLVLHAQAMPDGGLLLILRGAGAMGTPAVTDENTSADPVEW